ncbi:MAG: hypothetical protein JO151_10980 [Verrucomicrobia bacterium]|nr:hypothetical protein [Verrucomicrobiota bacterium]
MVSRAGVSLGPRPPTCRDGAQILTASKDKTAKLWETASGKLLASFNHQDAVNDARFSSDGARILTASADDTAKLWDAISARLIASFKHKDAVYTAAFSPDGTRRDLKVISTATSQRQIRIGCA